jgi:hypothetical protein
MEPSGHHFYRTGIVQSDHRVLIPDCGIGGRVLPYGEFTLGGIGLSGIIGGVLNLMLPAKR